MNDSTDFVSLSYGLITYENGKTYEQVKSLVVIQEENQSVIKQVEYNTDSKKFEISTYEEVEGESWKYLVRTWQEK